VKRFWASLLVLTVLIPVAFVPAAADESVSRHRSGERLANAGADAAYGSAGCSLGWWQTLRYGHVRPQWGVRCFGRRRRVD
jgi:hypothetical protein